MYTLNETVAKVNELGVKKVKKSAKERLILSFIAGAMIAFGYLGYIKLVATIEGGLGVFLGASVFPIGLIVILCAGGELITGNMMVVGTAYLNKVVTLKQLINNWLQVTFGNFLGALFVAYVFGLNSGVADAILPSVHTLSHHKIAGTFMQTIISGIGCNWFVGLSVWLFIVGKDGITKIIGIWFPVMVFVLIGFQHSVANMFLLGMSWLQSQITLGEYVTNIGASYIGNIIGGVVFVGLLYSQARGKANEEH